MNQAIKNALIKILFGLIDTPRSPLTEKDAALVEKWLSETWQHPGFIKYIQMRDHAFLRAFGGGVGLREVSHDDYVRTVGQRFEALNLANKAKQSYERNKKKPPVKKK